MKNKVNRGQCCGNSGAFWTKLIWGNYMDKLSSTSKFHTIGLSIIRKHKKKYKS